MLFLMLYALPASVSLTATLLEALSAEAKVRSVLIPVCLGKGIIGEYDKLTAKDVVGRTLTPVFNVLVATSYVQRAHRRAFPRKVK